MPTFSSNTITNSRYGPRRDVNGRLWFHSQDAGERYFYMEYSDDEGASFTADGTVYDHGSNMGANGSRQYIGWCNDGETPIVAILQRGSPYTLRIFLRTGASTWTQWTGTVALQSPDASIRVGLFQGPDGTYHLLHFGLSGLTSVLKHYTSSGTGVAFTETYTHNWTTLPGILQGPHENNASDFLMDRVGNIYAVASGCYIPGTAANQGVIISMWSVVSRSWHPQNPVWNSGDGLKYWALDVQACFDWNGYIHVLAHPNGIANNFPQPYYSNNQNYGAWSAKVPVKGAEVAYETYGVLSTADRHAEIVAAYTGYGVNSGVMNAQHWSNESGSFVRTAVLDVATGHSAWRVQGDGKNLHCMPVPAAGMGFALNNYPAGSRSWFVTDDYALGTWKDAGSPMRDPRAPVVAPRMPAP